MLKDFHRLLQNFSKRPVLRVRRNGERYELHEQTAAGWRLRGLFGSHWEADRQARTLIHERGLVFRRRVRSN